jgi:hypothetical protein
MSAALANPSRGWHGALQAGVVTCYISQRLGFGRSPALGAC